MGGTAWEGDSHTERDSRLQVEAGGVFFNWCASRARAGSDESEEADTTAEVVGES